MNKGEPLIIFRALNGYYLKPYRTVFEGGDERIEMVVFGNLNELEAFLRQHFESTKEENSIDNEEQSDE